MRVISIETKDYNMYRQMNKDSFFLEYYGVSEPNLYALIGRLGSLAPLSELYVVKYEPMYPRSSDVAENVGEFHLIQNEICISDYYSGNANKLDFTFIWLVADWIDKKVQEFRRFMKVSKEISGLNRCTTRLAFDIFTAYHWRHSGRSFPKREEEEEEVLSSAVEFVKQLY